MKTKLICFIAACIMSTSAFAQPRAWAFGTNAELLFNGAPAFTNNMVTNEGCSIINDPNGNVVFYTDGIHIWNSAGTMQPLPAPLMGRSSATQSAIIIPVTCNQVTPCSKYFIFTVDDVEDDYVNSLRVSLATVSGPQPYTITILPSDLNIPLLGDPRFGTLINVSEKLTATPDNAGGFWVAAHGIGLYNCATGSCWTGNPLNFTNCSYEKTFFLIHVSNSICTTQDLLNANTTLTNPYLIQTIGNALRDGGHPYSSGQCPGYNGQGQMKFNLAGTQLAMTFGQDKQVQIFNFNNATGQISGVYATFSSSCAPGGAEVYGLEFSPDGNYLYTTLHYHQGQQGVYQYAITNPATICASEYVVALGSNNSYTYDFSALQLGPDLTNNNTLDIYIARNGAAALDVIADPNNAGPASNYIPAGAPLVPPGTCGLGLPTLVRNNCEGPHEHPECDACMCNNPFTLNNFTIDADGNSSVILNVGPGSIDPVTRFRITLVNYNSYVSDECLKCDVTNEELFGSIVGAPVLYGTYPVFAPYNPMVSVNYSHEVTWCFNPEVSPFNPGAIPLQLKFPPVLALACCKNDVDFCFRIEIWGEECKACDRLICKNGPLDKKMTTSVMQQNKIPANKITPAEGMIRTIPNPTQNSFDLKVPVEEAAGDLRIYDAHGAMVKLVKVTSETTTVDTRGWTPGIYIIRYKTATKSYEEKIVVNK